MNSINPRSRPGQASVQRKGKGEAASRNPWNRKDFMHRARVSNLIIGRKLHKKEVCTDAYVW